MSLLALYNLLLFLRLNCLHHCCYFNPSLCCLSPLFSFVPCRHFKGMLLVEILPGKGLIRVPGQILDRIMSLVWNLWDQNVNVFPL